MPDHDYRPPTDAERSILVKLLSADVPGIQTLRDQMEKATVRVLDECGSIDIRVDEKAPSHFHDGPVISTRQRDRNTGDEFGPHINILLFVKDGFLHELQIYKDDAGPIMEALDPSKFDNLLIDKRRLPVGFR